MKLTDKQNEAVHSTSGNVLVHAGAGSGKTSSYVGRIANLIGNEKVSPTSILGLTFTKDAAENMRKKLALMVGKNKAKEVHLSTFHSFAYGILKSHYPHEYTGKTIMQDWWRMSKLYEIVSKQGYGNNIGLNLSCKAGELGSFISYQKSNMIKEGMEVIIDEKTDYVNSISHELLQEAFDIYCEAARNARAFEFDDMLVDLYYKLKEDESLLSYIKNKYNYIMVDEFQDTNTVNMEIIKMIAAENLFVVGDFRQGIYGFINANIDNILNFTENFNDVNLIELQDNFRSTDNIVGFANKVIRTSPVEGYKKFSEQLAARNIEGNPVNVNIYKDEYTEVKSIGEKILLNEDEADHDFNDFAVLARTNSQLGFYESEFANMEIPVDLSNGKSFFDRKEISDMLAYAQHALDPEDDMTLRKVINTPNRFISKAVVNKLDEYSYNNDISLEAACNRMDSGKSNANIRKVTALFEQLREHVDDMNASKFLKLIYAKTRYLEHIEKTTGSTSEIGMKKDSINRLFDLAKKFGTIKKFLGHVSVIKSNNSKSREGVKLMTVHGSKGLEFNYVFLPTVTKDNFPHDMNSDAEEERRLFYVASSRAKQNMDVSFPVFTSDGTSTFTPSPFLVDVIGDEIELGRKKVIHGSNITELTYTAV